MWDIKPTSNRIFDCYFSSIVSFCETYNIEYRMALLKMWNFRFDKNVDQLITEDCLQSLAKYHGLSLSTNYIANAKDLLIFIKKNIHLSPVIISIDAISCPWCLSFQKYHFEQMDTLWDEYKRLSRPHVYKVDLSEKLYNMKKLILLTKVYSAVVILLMLLVIHFFSSTFRLLSSAV